MSMRRLFPNLKIARPMDNMKRVKTTKDIPGIRVMENGRPVVYIKEGLRTINSLGTASFLIHSPSPVLAPNITVKNNQTHDS